MRDVLRLPKAHLHLHLEGSARPTTIQELARREGIPLPTLTKPRFADFADFDTSLDAATRVLTRPTDLARICRELVEDEAADGVVYTEPMISPHHHAERFAWSPEDVLRLMHEAFEEASATTGVQVGLMIGIVRSWATEVAEEVARFAAENRRHGVVALGLAGAGLASHEEHERFATACSIARSADLTIVPHAGLLEGAANVRRALEVLAPKRIAHGVRAAEDPSVLKRLAEGRVVCDVCPSAEVGLGIFPDLSQVPVPKMLGAGVPVTLNADDPLLFGSSIAREYALARTALGLSDHELALIARYSIEASHLEASARQHHIAGIETWLAA